MVSSVGRRAINAHTKVPRPSSSLGEKVSSEGNSAENGNEEEGPQCCSSIQSVSRLELTVKECTPSFFVGPVIIHSRHFLRLPSADTGRTRSNSLGKRRVSGNPPIVPRVRSRSYAIAHHPQVGFPSRWVSPNLRMGLAQCQCVLGE